MADLSALIERIEALTGPSREVDALIEVEARRQQAYQVGLNDEQRAYWQPIGGKGEVHEGGTRYHSPEYTASIDAAVALVERVLPGWDYIIGHTNGGLTIHAQVGPGEMQFGHAPAIALILATLRALQAKGGE